MVEWKSTAVAVSGTVSGKPESVAFSGRARIQTRLALDPLDSGRAKILLQIDLGGVSGVGTSTLGSYVVEAQEVVTRKLAPTDMVEVTFPFHASNARAVSASRTGVVTFALGIDTATGAITAAKASITSPVFARQ